MLVRIFSGKHLQLEVKLVFLLDPEIALPEFVRCVDVLSIADDSTEWSCLTSKENHLVKVLLAGERIQGILTFDPGRYRMLSEVL